MRHLSLYSMLMYSHLKYDTHVKCQQNRPRTNVKIGDTDITFTMKAYNV